TIPAGVMIGSGAARVSTQGGWHRPPGTGFDAEPVTGSEGRRPWYIETRRLPSSSLAPSVRAGCGLSPRTWPILVAIAAMDVVVATVDFAARPRLAVPPDLQGALRGGVVLAIVGVAAARLLRRPEEPAPASPTHESPPPTGTEVLLACLADLPTGSGDA